MVHTIQQYDFGSRTQAKDEIGADAGGKSGTNVLFDPKDEGSHSGETFSLDDVLGHELFHAFDFQNGNMKGEGEIPSSSTDPAEIRAVNFENKIRNRIELKIYL